VVTRRKRGSDAPTAPADAAVASDEVARALAALPPGQREAIVLVSWLGLSDEEAGRVLQIEPVSVRSRLSRARSAIRQTLNDDDDGASDA
jgi:RNA polymerase sigma-70 factor (ECF subfamily)